MKRKFEVKVVIRIPETITIEHEVYSEHDLTSIQTTDEIIAKALLEVRHWDWAQEQLGNVENVVIEIGKPYPSLND